MEFSTYGIAETTSEGHRLGDVLWSYRTFRNHPVWGIGLGNNVNTGAFFSLLSTMGLIGFFVYYTNIVKTRKIGKHSIAF